VSPTALIIRSDGTTEAVAIPADENECLPFLKGAVGGYLEGIAVAEDLFMYVNEEGLLMHLEPNILATGLTKRLLGLVVPTLVGNVILVGNDGSPDTVGINDNWIKRLTSWGLWPNE
jgi:hypothetical protein